MSALDRLDRCEACGGRHAADDFHTLGTLVIGTHNDQEANDG